MSKKIFFMYSDNVKDKRVLPTSDSWQMRHDPEAMIKGLLTFMSLHREVHVGSEEEGNVLVGLCEPFNIIVTPVVVEHPGNFDGYDMVAKWSTVKTTAAKVPDLATVGTC